jgi:hypothetical protein
MAHLPIASSVQTTWLSSRTLGDEPDQNLPDETLPLLQDHDPILTMGADLEHSKSPLDELKPAVTAETVDNTLAEAIQYEHSLTFSQAIKLYPAAIGWSAFVSLGVIMLAFDPQLLGNFFAMPQFQKDFGYLFGDSVS